MPLTKEERIELLARAREKKRQLAEERKLSEAKLISKPVKISETEQSTIVDLEMKTKPKPKPKPKPVKRTLDISTIEDVKKAEDEFEIKNEVIRIKAPKKKTIVKRVIEVEEPSSDEEIQEEIINVPKKKSSKPKETEIQVEREPRKQSETKQQQKDTFKNSKLFYDIFPNN